MLLQSPSAATAAKNVLERAGTLAGPGQDKKGDLVNKRELPNSEF